MKKGKQERKCMWLCGVILFLLTLIMVKAEMGKGHEVLLYSDFATHSSWAVGEFTDPAYDKFYAYPVWHFLVRGLHALLPIGREYAGAAVTALCIGFTAFVLFDFLWKELGSKLSRGRICLLDLGLLMLTALYMPWFNREVYLGQSSPTIWHNPTNMAVKPLALVIFLWFVQIFRKREKAGRKDFIVLSFLLLLSCFVKPSFVQGFLPGAALFLLTELVLSRGKLLGFCVKTAVAVMPSVLYFLAQFRSVFGEESKRSIGLAPFAVMRLDTEYPLLSILQAAAFPLFVLCCLGVKRIVKDKALLLAVFFYAASLLEFILFIEVQEAASGNFEWALQLALFVLFVMTAVRFYQMEKKPLISVAGKLLFAYHVCSGIYYYIYLLVLTPIQC